MNGYLTPRCAGCTRWCNDDYDYGCASLDPYSCVYIQKTIRENRTEGKTNDRNAIQHGH